MEATSIREVDIIIAGAGMAGLSLWYHLRDAGLSDLTVLLVDRSRKSENDRTWSFWEQGSGPFDHVVSASWEKIRVTSPEGERLTLPLGKYRYKTIRSEAFYADLHQRISRDDRTDILQARILDIRPDDGGVTLVTDRGEYRGTTLFDSIFQPQWDRARYPFLFQHFYGQVVRSAEPVFDPGIADIMDFRLPDAGDCRFMYILPFSRNEALVEYTLFTPALLERNAYRPLLESWLGTHLGGHRLEVLEEEFGVIPMCEEPLEEYPHSRVIRIGTAGGYTNPATGYTWTTTQRRLAEMVRHFQETGSFRLMGRVRPDRFRAYAGVLLDVLHAGCLPAASVFWGLYTKNPVGQVLRFLDGETTIVEETRLLSSVPWGAFTRAGGRWARRRLWDLVKGP